MAEITMNIPYVSNNSTFEYVTPAHNLQGLCLNYQLSLSITNVVSGNNHGPAGVVTFEQGPSKDGPWTTMLPRTGQSGAFNFQGDSYMPFQTSDGQQFIQFIRAHLLQTQFSTDGSVDLVASIIFDCGCCCSNT
jgi:hypothetical protein